MIVTIRLYKKQDFDLLALYYHPLFDLKKAIKHILLQYANGIYQPLVIPNDMHIINKGEIPSLIQIQLCFDEKKDGSKVIHLIKNVISGYRNNFIKNITRSYLSGFHSQLYMKDQEYAMSSLQTDFSQKQDLISDKSITETKKSEKKPKKEVQKNEEKIIIKVEDEKQVEQKKERIKQQIEDKKEEIKIVQKEELEDKKEETVIPVVDIDEDEDEDAIDIFGSLDKMLENF